jgi:hypothetical protein
MYLCDGMRHASRGEWECSDCGAINHADDASCECAEAQERREAIRRTILAKLDNLSPRERRERLTL